ncbi:MAG: hypothetical protein R3E68_11595 [Burkholderiaceae bacterium]
MTGRSKDVIIRGAHNIDPILIEEALCQHPDVASAAAIGVPDPHSGEVPVAYVALHPGAGITGEQLLAWVRPHVSEAAAVPKAVRLVPTMPLTAIGKIYKPELQRQATEHVFAQLLAQRGLDRSIRVAVADNSGQLEVVYSPVDAEHDEQACAAWLADCMRPFALSWRWDGASLDTA